MGAAAQGRRNRRAARSNQQTAPAEKKTGKEQEDAVEAMRRKRMPFWKIAAKVGLSRATAARIGKARGLSLLSALEPEEPVIRYEKEAPGDMIHIDIKRLAVSKASGIA